MTPKDLLGTWKLAGFEDYAHPSRAFTLANSCTRLIGVTTPRPPHWSQGLVRKGNRLGTAPLPSQAGQS